MSSNTNSQQELFARIKELEEEMKKLKSRKKYGLVWEDKPEDVVLQCEKQIPVLKEIKNRKIVTDNTRPTNLLIEGDNYHALSVLNYTHKGKIDVIYIDPPYNTGNKDFIYNDDYVDREDSFRHSKWLSFIEKRLRLAKDLLKDSGAIFISIDDNEQAQLKLLCDSILGEHNFIANLIWENKEGGGGSDSAHFKIKHEYILVYGLKKDLVVIKNLKIENDNGYTFEDNYLEIRGRYKLIKLNSFSIQYSKSLDYPIILPNGETKMPSEDGKKGCWRWSENKFLWGLENDFIVFKNGNVYTKQYFNCDNEGNLIERSKTPIAVISSYSSTMATKQLENIFKSKVFNYSKPYLLIKDLVDFHQDKNSVVLDFMAGSGTTGHAVMELNKEDGGNRQYILCTNNENNICEEVTYERLKRVIKGYTNKKGENIEGFGGNLEYLKCEYIDKTRHSDNMKMRLMRACSEMLCLKENTFNLEKEVKDGDTLMYRIYSGIKVISQEGDSTTVKHYMGVYYDLDDSYLEDMRSELKQYEDSHKTAYIFSLRSVSDFIDDYRKWKGIHIEEVPEKILEIYETIYKRNNRR
ncbi:MAG: site-specific DNA-methyltransferase [Candidatus Pacebacteria bacterium]|nr:site-specific DNA-methyltransferase [Candidatus Paceibacterota bacterium]MBP9867093.1 site-specific DNA-methyltransferase [Candidatus Paceibacterota bacterium]